MLGRRLPNIIEPSALPCEKSGFGNTHAPSQSNGSSGYDGNGLTSSKGIVYPDDFQGSLDITNKFLKSANGCWNREDEDLDADSDNF